MKRYYYELKGMSCDGCVDNVKSALIELQNVVNADVKLNPPGVVITMNEPMDTSVLQTQLSKAGNYTILSQGDVNGEEDDTPDIERSSSFSNTHTERQDKPFGIDHEPGVL
ncbi:hypothetical protein ADIARSV_2723 [Arcticibacter svalbardensis MN12-7]|uniref:HMA domain-containing protein n=1 Tax=Arcticibacter svalbardensis MN12-7 TaxID=1150600 RepID=R9GRF0_9SPHI|nr:heavy-metal-associated domain-containing protein [Arcticibacter svalbardensis]EOR94110.1 hypothetical protein ADIARSV_2723 [Arcticibacter svalbardensis MN12-7]